MIRYYRVFSIDDIEGIDFDIPGVEKDREHTPIEAAEKVVENMTKRPKIVNETNRSAYYHPAKDFVNMPLPEKYKKVEAYYSTLFHELVHATGHKSRLNRSTLTEHVKFGSPTYSKEELTAEFGAAFICARLGISNEASEENSAAYLKGWVKKLKSDPKFLFKASAAAQKAADFILGE